MGKYAQYTYLFIHQFKYLYRGVHYLSNDIGYAAKPRGAKFDIKDIMVKKKIGSTYIY